MNSKLHTVCNARGRLVAMLLSEGQMSDHKGAALMFYALPRAAVLIGGIGYDSRRLRDALAERCTSACIPSSRSRKVLIPHDKAL